MTSIIREAHIDTPVADVWDAVRDFGAVDRRLPPGSAGTRAGCDLARVVRLPVIRDAKAYSSRWYSSDCSHRGRSQPGAAGLRAALIDRWPRCMVAAAFVA